MMDPSGITIEILHLFRTSFSPWICRLFRLLCLTGALFVWTCTSTWFACMYEVCLYVAKYHNGKVNKHHNGAHGFGSVTLHSTTAL